MSGVKKIFPLIIAVFSLSMLGFSAPTSLSFQVTRVVLDNGLTVLIKENPNLPLVHMKARIKAGSLYEPKEKAGLANFVGRTLTKGTKTKSAEEIASKIEFVGGYLVSWGGSGSSYVACQVLKKDTDLALELISDVLIDPSFDSAKIERERESVLSEILSRKDDPGVLAKLTFKKLVFGKHPDGRPLCGYEETVKGISRKDLIDFHRKYYVANNTILAIVGDVNTEALLEKIRGKFSRWPKRPVKFPDLPVTRRQKEIKQKYIFMEKEQVQIYLGHLGIRRTNPDYYILKVMDVILGTANMSARIPYNLRDVKGLAYTALGSITESAELEPGFFLAYMAVAPQNKDAAITGLLEEIEKIRNEPVSDQELEVAKSYLINSYYFTLEGNSAVADYLIFCAVMDLGLDFMKKYPSYIKQVSKEDIQRVAKKYLHPEAYTLVVVGPGKN